MSENAQERVIKGDSSTGHAQFEFSQKWSQVYTNRHDRLLTADHCIELITGKPHPPCKLDMQKS